ncbi:MAG: tetratricopeptide repeat protein [Betaproteobacteria bacterium]
MPPSPEILSQAQRLLADRQPEQALALLDTIAAHDDEAMFLAARAEESLGRTEAARDRLLALRARLPRSTAPLEMQLGLLHHRLGQTGEAVAALEAAIALKPDLGAAHKNLVAVLVAGERIDEAHAALQRALATNASDTGLWLRLAAVETHRGDSAACLAALGKAAQTMPVSAASWREIGYSYMELWKYEEADRALALASALDPGEPEIETHRALARQELGDTAGALKALAAAIARAPDDLRAVVSERLMLPQVYEGAEDVARWRTRYMQGLGDIEARLPSWLPRAREVFDINRNNFLLAYQGLDDREPQQRYSAFLARLLARARPEWRSARPIRFRGERRLRVGFAGSLFRDCTAGRYFERWITGLDAERFERFVYHTSPVVDAFTQRIAAASEHFATLRTGPEPTAARIEADGLDVLVQPEVGMNALTYQLAALRLAPVQCAGWGHPVTTGSDAIDAFFTCEAMEPTDAQDHYVEHLVRLPGLGVSYSMPAPQPPLERAQVGLPADRRLYVCAQSVFKVHPDMDGLLADIVASDDDAVLVFFQALGRHATDNLAARLQRALAERGIAPRGQLKFLPRMESGYFRRVLALADVVLDTVHWSGGNTSIDAFAAGAPVVTLPGRFMRGRQTAGMLRLMGIPELVASSPGDYVRLAVDVARDRDRNATLRRQIVERRGVLFDQQAPVQAFAEALLALGSGRR